MLVLLLVILFYVILRWYYPDPGRFAARPAGYHDVYYDFTTVSFHNFKSQNLKLSVSNPKSK